MSTSSSAPATRVRKSIYIVLAGLLVAGAEARLPARATVPLRAIVDVSTVPQLQSAVANLTSGTTIRIAPGRYALTSEMQIRNGVTNVEFRGATGNRDDVVIVGTGMTVPGINIPLKVENAQDVLIANVSIGEAFYHPIQMQGEAGADRVHISNVRLFDAGEQFLKSTVDSRNPNGVDDVIVENSLIEYTNGGTPHGYTEGIDVHHGANWIIRNNVFRNISVPPTAPDKFRPAILMWSGSRNTLVYGNVIINCERGIIFGLGPQPPYLNSHSGGAIFNNFIYRTNPIHADAGISLWDSPGTKVFHNTVIQNGTYPSAIEYRFPSTNGVEIINNLTDGEIQQRDGAQAVVTNNETGATASYFVNAAAGDLHLAATATGAIDRGVNLPTITVDIDGDPRVSGPLPDLGADELRLGEASPQIITPPAGATLPGTTQVFEWTAGTGVAQYWLCVGSTQGGCELYSQEGDASLTATVAGLPSDGRTLYARLWWLRSGVWEFADSTYVATSAAVNPQITQPAPGSTLAGASQVFQWSAGTGISQYWLYVGSAPGGNDLYDQDRGTTLSASVSGLPTDGRTLYARLWWLRSGTWAFADFTFTAASGGANPRITTPPPGATLGGTTQVFQWTAGAGVAQYWLYIGSALGDLDLFDQDRGVNLHATVTGLPADGRMLFVRLWWLRNGVWEFADFTYRAAGG